MPCVGFGMGIERILMLMEAKGVEIANDTAPDLYIASIGEKAQEKAFTLCYKLRLLGVKCEIDHMQRSVKPQFKYADKICAKNVITIGDSEMESNKANIKRMKDGLQTECLLVAEEIAKIIL